MLQLFIKTKQICIASVAPSMCISISIQASSLWLGKLMGMMSIRWTLANI